MSWSIRRLRMPWLSATAASGWGNGSRGFERHKPILIIALELECICSQFDWQWIGTFLELLGTFPELLGMFLAQ